jgi:hypothetical protein
MREGGIVAVALQIATDDYLHFLVSCGKFLLYFVLVFFFKVFLGVPVVGVGFERRLLVVVCPLHSCHNHCYSSSLQNKTASQF